MFIEEVYYRVGIKSAVHIMWRRGSSNLLKALAIILHEKREGFAGLAEEIHIALRKIISILPDALSLAKKSPLKITITT